MEGLSPGWDASENSLGRARDILPRVPPLLSPPCRKCGPRLSVAAAEKLKNRYILMRSGSRQHEEESDRRSSIPITVR